MDELDLMSDFEDTSEDVSIEEPVEVLDDISIEEPVEALEDVPAEESVEVLDDVPVEEPVEVLDDVSAEEPAEVLDDVPVEEPVEVLDDVPAEEPVEVLDDVPVEEEPVEVPDDVPVEEEPIEVLDDIPAEEPFEVLDDVPAEEPVEGLDDVPAEESVEVLDDVPVEESVEVLDDVPVEKPVEVLDDVPVEEPVEVLDDVPMEEPVEVLDDVPVEESVEVLDDVPAEESVEVLDDVSAKEPVEVLDDVSAEEPVEVLDDVSAEEPVEVLDEVPAKEPVEVLDDVPAEEPVEVLDDVPAEEPVEDLDDVPEEVPIEAYGDIPTEETVQDASVEELTETSDDITEVLPEEGLETSDAPMELSASEWEQLVENTSDRESLERLREDVLDGKIVIDQQDEESGGIKLERNLTEEQLEGRQRDAEEVLENYRENLRERGVDEESIASFIDSQREEIDREYESPLDESSRYAMPNDWNEVAAELQEEKNDITEDMEDEFDVSVDGDIQEKPTDENVSEMLDEASYQTTVENMTDIPIDYESIYEEHTDEFLQEDFQNIDIERDLEQLNQNLENFEPDAWEQFDNTERENAISNLAEYIKDAIGFENPPAIEYYNNPQMGDYGGYNRETNTLSINQFMLFDSKEAADTVAHELYHAHQYERAENPQCERDLQYRANFENYIKPQYGQETYENQLVEAEARAFAAQIKERLGHSEIRRR